MGRAAGEEKEGPQVKNMTMNDRMKLMFREFVFNEKPKKMITEVNGLALPEDYLAFMQEHDGGEGPLGENNYGRFFRLQVRFPAVWKSSSSGWMRN